MNYRRKKKELKNYLLQVSHIDYGNNKKLKSCLLYTQNELEYYNSTILRATKKLNKWNQYKDIKTPECWETIHNNLVGIMQEGYSGINELKTMLKDLDTLDDSLYLYRKN